MKALFALLQSILQAIFGVSVETEVVKAPEHRIKNLDLITYWEKLKLHAYLPTPHDVWTIGWGHTKGVKKGDVITREQAVELLHQDIAWVVKALDKHVKVPLSQEQFDALASLVFNIGETNFRNSTVLRRLNDSDYRGAANAFLMWNKQRQNGKLVVLRGLKRRREQEREYFLKGTK